MAKTTKKCKPSLCIKLNQWKMPTVKALMRSNDRTGQAQQGLTK